MNRWTLVLSKFLSESMLVSSMNCESGWKLVQVAPWPSGSKLMVTFGFVALNLSLMPAMAFLNASALDPEFQAMTLIVTGPPPLLAAGWAAAGAVVAAGAAAGAAGFGASAGLDSAGF